MLRLISASDARALAKVVDHVSSRDTSLERRVATILADVRKSGDRAVIAYAKRFDKLTGAMEVSRDEIEEGAAQALARGAPRHPRCRTAHPRGGQGAGASLVEDLGDPGHHDRATRHAARSRGLLRARWTLSPALVAADDRHPGTCGRRRRRHRRVPAARTGRHVRRHRGGRRSPLPHRGRPRDRRDGLRHGEHSARGQDRRPRQCLRGRGQVAGHAATARSTSTPGRARS